MSRLDRSQDNSDSRNSISARVRVHFRTGGGSNCARVRPAQMTGSGQTAPPSALAWSHAENPSRTAGRGRLLPLRSRPGGSATGRTPGPAWYDRPRSGPGSGRDDFCPHHEGSSVRMGRMDRELSASAVA